ncbi:NAD(P)-binding protein [Pseudovirgaria hyperparasitica]|uniref:NAD(P)-binding protein n=1 Tax=Pseudovirgaria hyperparasitica TaxID=470096 RepID=A0A6A6VVL7_9PEZI|nr:NAD(P)-binding protein [Pseudovirgaria hyperparasitica]KAF2754215.1 NAD(P)-binding protein [Pseudovirgaria hyperparasitica]
MGLGGDIVQMNIGQIFQSPFVPSVDLTGQTIVITGANTGLGFEAAKHLYSLNVSYLILACRSERKGEKAKNDVIASSRRSTPGKVEVWPLDMSDNASILAFGERLKTLPCLDAFIANAGVDRNHFELDQGYESCITINVISTYLVAFLALPKLYESSKLNGRPSRLVIVGTVVHIFAKHEYLVLPQPGQVFASLNNDQKADMGDRYNLSKLISLLSLQQLAKEASIKYGQDTPVICFPNPGWCRTELFRTNNGGLGGRIGLRLIGRSAEEGSRALVHAAVTDEDFHGKYISECRVKPVSTWMRTDEAPKVGIKVWAELKTILEHIQPGVTQL